VPYLRLAPLAALLALASCTGSGALGGSTGGAGTGGSATGGAAADAGEDVTPPSDASAADASDGATFDCSVLGVPGNCMDTAACAAMTNYASTPGYCPGPSNIECCTPYGVALCDPMAKPRPAPNAGNTAEAPGEGGCPAGMIPVSTFCIDKYEASLVRMDTGEAWCPYDNPGTTPMVAVSVAGAVPQAYIDQVQAGAACANAGKRLCADTEWLRACQGPNGDTYPYGDTRMPGVCNDHRDVHPMVEYFGTSASWIWSDTNNACIDQIPETVDHTGSLTGCVSAEGAFDMMGNLHEWTADPAGTFRGGYYVDTTINGNGCLYVTTAHAVTYWDYSIGFRCCAN
jgi:hypothetical protein